MWSNLLFTHLDTVAQDSQVTVNPGVMWLTPSLCSGPCPELTSSQSLQQPAYLDYTKHPITLYILSLYLKIYILFICIYYLSLLE